MKFTTILFVLFVAIGYVICEEEIKLDEGVLVLTKDNFKAVTTDNEHILVEFCKYCDGQPLLLKYISINICCNIDFTIYDWISN